jgi:NTE family protein
MKSPVEYLKLLSDPCKHKAHRSGPHVKILSLGLAAVMLSGCASYGKVENINISDQTSSDEYSIHAFNSTDKNSDLSLILTFSGGGTRAAAMAYGVMQELRDTQILIDGERRRMLDEVDRISSVSGGSFTSAYYGLNGDGIFDTFEDDFLRYDIDKHLIYRLMNPILWFSSKGRTEMAVEYYQKQVFHDATFADMLKPGRPMIVINASDLAYGVRFSFIQEYFNLLCSDLASFPVARAVAASSAVPALFNPVVVKNYPDCSHSDTSWLDKLEVTAKNDPALAMLVHGLETYADKEQRKYIHFVDGGITDNTGLRALYDVMAVSGGAVPYLETFQRKVPRQLVVISVNASTDPVFEMDSSNKQPSMIKTMNAVTGVQLHRYNNASIALVDESLRQWAKELSTEDKPVSPYFIQVSFKGIKQPELKHFLNKIPTSFSLSDEQVDALIKSGRELLRNHPVFQQLLNDINQAEK